MSKDFNNFNILKLNSESNDIEVDDNALNHYKKINKKLSYLEQIKMEEEKKLKKIERLNNPKPKKVIKPPKPVEEPKQEKPKKQKKPKNKLPKVIKHKKLVIDFTK